MPKWKPGESGNPGGKKMTAALRRVLNDAVTNKDGTPVKDEDGNQIKKLHRVAEALVNKAMDGDTTAIEQCFTRLDGKVPNVNMNVETPLDGADTSALAALQEALEGIAGERTGDTAEGDEGETLH